MRRSHFITTLFIATLLACSQIASAALLQQGDYEIHYNAFNSTFILPEVAQKVGIERSKRKALVNISVLKVDGHTKTPVNAHISGKATNLIQQEHRLTFKKIKEPNAIYYIGEFSFSGEQIMRLDIEVQPDPNKAPYRIKFEQKFYEE